ARRWRQSKARGRRNRRVQPGRRPKGLPPSQRPTPFADRATSECAESPMIERASGRYLLQLSRLPSGLLGISRHLLGTTHEVDDRHNHQDDNECSKTDVHKNLLSWIATVH